jgi:SAM-dependent methyltransferase
MDLESKHVSGIYSIISGHFSSTRFSKWPWITKFLDSFEIDSEICDIGCGNGRNMSYSELSFSGIDSCQEFVDICKSKNLDVIHGDMCKLPYFDNSFDGIISIASFHHLATRVRRLKGLHEIYRIMKPDSRCLISVWSKNQPEKTKRKFDNYGDNYVPWNKDGEIYQRYYYIFILEEIQNLFIDAGFQILEHKWDCGNEIFILKK